MARPTVAPPALAAGALRPDVSDAIERWAARRIAEPEVLVRFFNHSIDLLPGHVRSVARFGFAGGRFALVIGNYYLSCAGIHGLGMAGLDTSVVPSALRPFVFASAYGPAVFAHYPWTLAEAVTSEPAFWETYPATCDLLLGSSQGRSPHFLTSRSREPLANVLV